MHDGMPEADLDSELYSREEIAFHRARIPRLSNLLGAWARCAHSKCRRAGACRGHAGIFPPCLLPVVHDVGDCVGACSGTVPRRPVRRNPDLEQLQRANRLAARMIERQLQSLERSLDRKEQASEAHSSYRD